MQDLPLVLCGPIVRRTAPDRVCVWMAVQKPCTVELTVHEPAGGAAGAVRMQGRRDTVKLAEHLHVVAVSATLDHGATPLEWGRSFLYHLSFGFENTWQGLYDEGILRHDVADADDLARLVYDGHTLPGFRLPSADLDTLRFAHGSCRKPHNKGADALLLLDQLLAGEDPPQMFFLTGDQIYADDVDPHFAKYDEASRLPRGLLDAIVDQAAELFGGEDRERATELSVLASLFESGKRGKLVREHAAFTSGESSCHLVTLAEFYTMYLFVWSDVLWDRHGLADRESLSEFYQALPHARRALANVSTYMSFDDHDVTDDWNRTGRWVANVEASDLGTRIIRNALVAFGVFQHWGNVPEVFEAGAPGGNLLEAVDGWDGTNGDREVASPRRVYVPPSVYIPAGGDATDSLPDSALRWHYTFETPECRFAALDSRTRRRYRDPDANPGLMSQAAIDEVLDASATASATVVVSPAPVLGVGLIEFIQDKVGAAISRNDDSELITGNDKFDAEAWAFDEEISDYLLERLASYRRVVLLSGDVHYGFGASLVAQDDVYDARIINFVSSSLHNEVFTETVSKLLSWIGNRQLEALTDEEPVPLEIPTNVESRKRSLSSMAFDEGLLHEGGDAPEEAADRGEVEFERFAGSRKRAEVVGSCNVGEINFPEGQVQQRLHWLGRKRILRSRKQNVTVHLATFDR